MKRTNKGREEMDTQRLLELVDGLERNGPNGDPYEGYSPWLDKHSAKDFREALRKLEMLEQGVRQILLNSL
jgi:hypothetical protein